MNTSDAKSTRASLFQPVHHNDVYSQVSKYERARLVPVAWSY